MRGVRGWVVVAMAAWMASGCAQVPVKRGEIAGLEKLMRQAERNGAKRCAPRELALAQSHTRFASVELDQADMFRAEDHLIVARANAQAAYDLSPPARCSDRPIVVEGDRDGDGNPDDTDNCPDDPENYQGFEDADGCPDDPDTDGDGISDANDGCELLAEDKDGYLDDDGCPDVDNDLDGVADDSDGKDGSCKDDPEDPDGYQDEDGCPEEGPPSLVVVTDKEIKITQQIHFEFAKATIRSISYPVLDAVVSVLETNPKIRIEVQGHTDNVGAKAYNQQLSSQRADAVRTYLVNKGIANSRLVSRGYGMDRPLVPNDDARNRALNRRVQFIRIEK